MNLLIVSGMFSGDLGKPYLFLYTTSDEQLFTDEQLARDHAKTLEDNQVLIWFEEWSGDEILPNIVSAILNDENLINPLL